MILRMFLWMWQYGQKTALGLSLIHILLCSGGEQPVHGAQLIELDPEKKYNQRSTDEKLLLLRQIEELMTKSEWQQMLGWQSGLSDAENTQNRPEHFIWNLIRQYLSDSSDGEEYGRSQEKDYLYHKMCIRDRCTPELSNSFKTYCCRSNSSWI